MDTKFFTVMVVGDNPDELMKKYDNSLKVKPYIKYKYLDAEKLRNNAIKMMKELVENYEKYSISKFQCDYFKERLKAINGMSTFEYYSTITHGLYYDAEGNALSEENPDGKWDKYNIGKNYSYPFTLKSSETTYQTTAGEVDWNLMHMNPKSVNLFEIIWALVVDDNEPSTDEEAKLKEMWEKRKNYLSNFSNVDEFVAHNCAFWTYAYLDKDGWVDIDEAKNETEWITNYFDRFVEPLNDNDKVTILEFCRFNKD
jgi:hypothetical protein